MITYLNSKELNNKKHFAKSWKGFVETFDLFAYILKYQVIMYSLDIFVTYIKYNQFKNHLWKFKTLPNTSRCSQIMFHVFKRPLCLKIFDNNVKKNNNQKEERFKCANVFFIHVHKMWLLHMFHFFYTHTSNKQLEIMNISINIFSKGSFHKSWNIKLASNI